tara:strand:+ start:7796 stop:8386 length:591 start_codon:yes stop_codon:yes gene_type:complete
MTEVIGRTTRLEAINTMLRNIGERQVATLVDSTRGDVAAAVSELNAISRAVQGEGWHWNYEKQELSPGTDKKISVPSNALYAGVVGQAGYRDEVVLRGDYFYNKTDNTYLFTDDIEVEMVLQVSFEELPEEARQYIMIRAARVLAQNRVGDQTIIQFSAADEQMARVQLETREMESGDYHVFQEYNLSRLHNPWLR